MGTAKGETKEFIVERSPLQYYYIRLSGGGQVPEELSGMYTHIHIAERAIADYTPAKKKSKKVDKDA